MQSQETSGRYLDTTVEVETVVLGLPAPKWMGLEDLTSDTSVVCIAERVLSGDCNDGINYVRLADLLAAMMNDDEIMHAWLTSSVAYRKLFLDKLDISKVAGFAPFDVRPVEGGGYGIIRSTEINPGPSMRQLLNTREGILSCKLSRSNLQQIGLPSSVLTFSGWQDDRMAINLINTSEDSLLTTVPSYADLLNVYQIVVFPAGDHGSDCIIASKYLSSSDLADKLHLAMDKLKWRWASRGNIDGEGYGLMYERSMAEERHPGHSRIELDLE